MNVVLSPDELAGSCYRVFCLASGMDSFAPWEHLSLEFQEPWLRMALAAEAVLVGCEGRSYAQAGCALAEAQCKGDEQLLNLALSGTRNRTCYEALARHLMTLFESEKVPDVGTLELSWRDWAAGKVPYAGDAFLIEMEHAT